MVLATYSRSRYSKTSVYLFRPRKAAREYAASAPTLRATLFLVRFWILGYIGNLLSFYDVSTCHIFPTDLMLYNVYIKYTVCHMKMTSLLHHLRHPPTSK